VTNEELIAEFEKVINLYKEKNPNGVNSAIVSACYNEACFKTDLKKRLTPAFLKNK
jgi:hypothetical protein